MNLTIQRIAQEKILEMPHAFDKCVRTGGQVRTISHGDKYIHVCKPKKGKWAAGHAKTKKSGRRRRK